MGKDQNTGSFLQKLIQQFYLIDEGNKLNNNNLNQQFPK